jgi:hypothetical protein
MSNKSGLKDRNGNEICENDLYFDDTRFVGTVRLGYYNHKEHYGWFVDFKDRYSECYLPLPYLESDKGYSRIGNKADFPQYKQGEHYPRD